MSFEFPDFMKEDEDKEGKPKSANPSPDFLVPKEAVFIRLTPQDYQEPQDRKKIPKLTEAELVGLYVTTNAMMNILVRKGIISHAELMSQIEDIQKKMKDR